MSASINYNLTGIEHAMLKRLFLLDKKNIKIVTLNFSNFYPDVLKKHNIDESCLLNFYRNYSGFREDKPFYVSELVGKLFEARVVNDRGHNYNFYQDERLRMSVVCFSGTKRVYCINYYDEFKKIIRRETYDYLGYLSSEIVLSYSKIIQQTFYNANKEVFLKINHSDEGKHYTLIDGGVKFFYSDIVEMQAFWLKKILNDRDIVFIDKNRIYNPILSKLLDIKLKKIAIIHSTHTHNPNIDDKKKVNSNYKFLLENQNQFSACVVATESQYNDLRGDFKMEIPVYVIPPSYIESHRVNPNLENDHLRILSIGRIAVEKRQEDMIKAMKLVIQAVPNATLELYGMANVEIKNKLIALIESENLKKNVYIKPYVSDIKKELYNAHLSLVTSKVESFCIAILDSLEQGTPVISYDIKYGPAAIIDHELNGFLVKDGNIQSLAETIISYYQSGMNLYRKNTFLVKSNYGREQIQAKWVGLLKDMSK